MFKSQLQEYAQKAGLPAPVYEVAKEGLSHEPQFKASVTIHGKVYASPRLFGSLKKAEHAAAEVALAALGKSETGPLHESGLCKNLLQEYAQKTKLPLPVYTVAKTGESHTPTFSATVEIAGVHYNGGKCKSKKEAEIKAARTALVAIYADSGAYSMVATGDQTAEPPKQEPPKQEPPKQEPPKQELPKQEPVSAAGETTSEPNSRSKRKKKFNYFNKRRKQKVKEEQTESAEEVGNKTTHVDDLNQVDPSPGTLVDDSKQSDASPGTLVDDSKQSDASPGTLVVDSKQSTGFPGTLVFDSKQSTGFPGTVAEDSMHVDPSPGTLVVDSKQSAAFSGTLADDSMHVDPSPGTLADDSMHVDPSPGTLVDGSKQSDASPGTAADDSKQVDPSPQILADDSKQADLAPGTLADDSKQVDPSLATDSGPVTSWVPEQEHVGTAADSCTIANSKVTACANGSAQEQQA